ncbi:MAG: Xaa-Pro dipeptidase [Bacteroidales bacterium]|nr:Xaa-Pro dipeptidase [Bacteroidales bacterium]
MGIPFEKLKESASVPMIKGVVALRERKSAEEIAEMEKICDLGVDMHLSAMRGAKAGRLERELAGTAEGISMSGGAGVSFPVILSQNGETLHNHNHEQLLENGRMLLCDAGAEAMSGYSSDYTRTFPVSGKFTQKQREIYEIVLRANMETFQLARPGIRYFEVHLNAYRVIAEGLTALGLMKGNPADAALAGAPALFMPHGLGHMLGLDVHDMEDLGENYVGYDETFQRSTIFGHGSLRCGKTLQPGFIVTDEPGIYFIPKLIAIWEKEGRFAEYINYNKVREYIGFGGIRIEDDVLITDTGCRLLGKPLPKQPDELEAIIGK